ILHAAAIDAYEGFDGQVGQPVADCLKGAGDAALDRRSSLFNVETEDPIDLACPGAIGVFREKLPGFNADAVIVHAEESGVGMGNIHRDEWDSRGGDFVSD